MKMESQIEINSILKEIEFGKKYYNLIAKYEKSDKRILDISTSDILKLSSNLSSDISFHKKENYFSMKKILEEWIVCLNFKITKESIILIFGKNEYSGQILNFETGTSGSWGEIYQNLIPKKYDIPLRPYFYSINDVESILRDAEQILIELIDKIHLTTAST